jgi:small-conductance mechanosensitive channel
MNDNVEGQIIEIDWRATRIRTFANDMVVIPNSVIAKAIVTNHRSLNEPRISGLSLNIDASVSPAAVIRALESAASASPGVASGYKPAAYACGFADSLVIYKLYFAVENFILTSEVLSQVTMRVINTLRSEGTQVGAPATAVRIIPNTAVAGALTAARDGAS